MRLSELAGKINPSPTLSLSARARRMKAEGKDVIALSAGELDFPPPKEVIDAAKRALDSGDIRYTAASGMPALKQAVCDRYRRKYNLAISSENVVISSGAKHSLANVLLALLNPGDEVIIPVPYWVSYPEMVKLAGGKPVFVRTSPENRFKLTVEMLENAATEKTRVLMLNSPNNPTGTVYARDEIEAIYRFARERSIVVLADEIYEDLVFSGGFFSFAQIGGEIFENVVIVSGVSKTYAMTGWRIGWAVGHPELIAAVGR
ncbi:aminotransferase class I/II-fold pyridoxal phosphate-dependent enzyme, partial [bacterium]|nr:aminotransferase class I/II-fold pyridoxal phosphate-dependent enzyme [bacterium]